MNSKIGTTLYAFHKPWVRIVATLMLSIMLALTLAQTSQAGLSDAQKKTIGLAVLEKKGVLAIGQRDLRETIADIINVALSLLGIIAVVVVLIGGFYWMTAGGNDDQITKAKGWIFSGIIGLAIILSAFAISKFVLERLGEATDLGAT